jgi:hypothetical protein
MSTVCAPEYGCAFIPVGAELWPASVAGSDNLSSYELLLIALKSLFLATDLQDKTLEVEVVV